MELEMSEKKDYLRNGGRIHSEYLKVKS